MFWLSPSLTLLMLTVVPPVSLGAVFYGRYLKKLSNRTQEAVLRLRDSHRLMAAVRSFANFNCFFGVLSAQFPSHSVYWYLVSSLMSEVRDRTGRGGEEFSHGTRIGILALAKPVTVCDRIII